MFDPWELVGLTGTEVIRLLGFDEASVRLAEQLYRKGKLDLHVVLVQLSEKRQGREAYLG